MQLFWYLIQKLFQSRLSLIDRRGAKSFKKPLFGKVSKNPVIVFD